MGVGRRGGALDEMGCVLDEPAGREMAGNGGDGCRGIEKDVVPGDLEDRSVYISKGCIVIEWIFMMNEGRELTHSSQW